MMCPAPSYESRLNAFQKKLYESPLKLTMFCWSTVRAPGNGSPSCQTWLAGANCCSKTRRKSASLIYE